LLEAAARDLVWSTAQLPLRVALSELLPGWTTARAALDGFARQWHRRFRLAGLKG
jgi:hypothetical protein